MQDLTKSEEQIMQILWKIKKGFVKDIIEHYDDPKPAYNTVSTIVRILEKKNFVSYKSYGKSHQYYPIVKKEEYSSFSFTKMMDGYFNNSYQSLVSFFSKEKDLSIEEMEEIKNMLDKQIKNKRK